MPRKGRKRSRAVAAARWEPYSTPLVYTIKEGSAGQTSVSTVPGLDRDRAFRIVGVDVSFAASSLGPPGIIQVRVWGPQSAADDVWCSGPITVGTTTVTRRFRLPKSVSLAFPSESAPSTVLMVVEHLCVHKTSISEVVGQAQLHLLLAPVELERSCPKVQPTVMLDSPFTSLSD